jgi:uncharacterized protein YraI
MAKEEAMKYFKALGLVTVALLGLPVGANAEIAYAAKQVHLRAGPDTDYPVVVTLPAGVALDVQACLSDYRWCDVIAGPDRGWVYAGNIAYPYQGSNVPVLNYGTVIGIGIVAFSLGSYWDSHYMGRPWYPQRPLWMHRQPPPRFVPDGHRPSPQPRYRPPGGQHPVPPGVRAPGESHPPGVQAPGAQRPSPAGRPPRAQPAERSQGRSRQAAPSQGSGGGQRQHKEQGPAGR